METRASTLPALPSLLPERLPPGPLLIGQWACSTTPWLELIGSLTNTQPKLTNLSLTSQSLKLQYRGSIRE